MRRSKKGVSEIVAAMMLITITVSAGILFYVYSSGLLGSLQGAQPQQPYANQIVLEYYNWPNSSTLTLYLRNTGSGLGILADFFVWGTNVTLASGSCKTYTTTALTPGNVCTAVLKVPSAIASTLTRGHAYPVKFVTKDGSVFSYNLILGQSGSPT